MEDPLLVSLHDSLLWHQRTFIDNQSLRSNPSFSQVFGIRNPVRKVFCRFFAQKNAREGMDRGTSNVYACNTCRRSDCNVCGIVP